MTPGRKLQKHTKQLFERLDVLQSIAFGAEVSGSGTERDSLERVGKFLPHFTERDIMEFTDHRTYVSGIDYFMQGRVSERMVWGDTLACRVLEGKAGRFPFRSGPRSYRVLLNLKESRGLGRFSMSGSCDCLKEQPLPRRDGPCGHVVALLVAWVRKPERFQPDQELARENSGEEDDGHDDEEEMVERKLELFEDELEEMVSSLGGVLSALESTSRVDDMEFLQRLYSKLRLSANQMTLGQAIEGSLVRQTSADQSTIKRSQSLEQAPMSGQYSGALNSLVVTIFAMMDTKYRIGALGLFNSSLVSVTGKVLENLVEGVGRPPRRRSAATEELEAREDGADLPSQAVPQLPILATYRSASTDPGMTVRPATPSGVPTMPEPGAHGPRAQGTVKRSWDAVIEGLGS